MASNQGRKGRKEYGKFVKNHVLIGEFSDWKFNGFTNSSKEYRANYSNSVTGEAKWLTSSEWKNGFVAKRNGGAVKKQLTALLSGNSTFTV